MFLAGANQDEAELRIPSIKGALRFWWRALVYGRYNGDLEKIREEEGRLFGGVGKGEGQSSILIRSCQPVTEVKKMKRGSVLPNAGKMPGVLYLAYGVIEAVKRRDVEQGERIRSCFEVPLEFNIEFVSKNKINDSIIKAIKALGLLGGLGSRSRRGFGSLILTELRGSDGNEWTRPNNIKTFKDELRELLKGRYEGQAQYTAFSADTRIVVADEGDDPLQLLNKVGEAMQLYRSYGRKNGDDHEVNRKPAEQNFCDDHRWMLEAVKGKQPEAHPQRVVFGLPHNYYFSSTKCGVNVRAENHDRRASPLLIHIHEFEPQKYAAILTIMKARFLPKGEKIMVAGGKNSGVKSHALDQQIDFSFLDDFVDGFIGPVDKKTDQKRFPNAVEVLR